MPSAISSVSVAAHGAAPAWQLSPEERAQVTRLAAIDRRVRAHEQAHLAAAGPYARGGPSYSFARGPDGMLYAVGGEVPLDTAPVNGDPEATIRKARVLVAAANAPADPSIQDRMVAAAATRMEAAARQELEQQRLLEAAEAAQLERAYGGPQQKPEPGELFSLEA